MNTNKFFSISRFYQLLRNDILLNHKKYLYTIAGAFILGFVILYTSMPRTESPKPYNYTFGRTIYLPIFISCLLGLGAFVGSAFSELGNKVKTTNYLLVPASTFEKFLSQFFIRIIVGTAIFLFVFWVDAHLARTLSLSQTVGPHNEPPTANVSKNIAEFHYSMFLIKNQINGVTTNWGWADGIAMLLGIFSLGVYLFSVKLFFKKMGLVKSMLALAAIIYFLTGFNKLLSHLFYPETVGFNNLSISYILNNGYTNVDVCLFAMAYFASLFLIPLGYYKLKEKQL